MTYNTTSGNVIGLAKTEIDVHTLGITTISGILNECGFRTVISNTEISKAFSDPQKLNNSSLIYKWIKENKITVLGFSYRLNADNAVLIFQKLMYQLNTKRLLENKGGPLRKICFAGLPEASNIIKNKYTDQVSVFYGDETHLESLAILGIDPELIPKSISEIHPYDSFLENFGKDVIKKGEYPSVLPVNKSFLNNYGTKTEKLVDRIQYTKNNNLPPLIRAHAGPYQQNRIEAIKLFIDWAKMLSKTGYLDILSIGTSQLSQEKFGEEWGNTQNGGGVPINSPEEYEAIYAAARPMLVKTYSGTNNIKALAEIYERTINISWHALSLWWFSQIDGRGPNSVSDNLKEHFDTIRYIASTGKPFEANVPHHFSFRGADDITYVVSAVLAARSAKKLGIHDFILQIMLNNPKHTWGVNDIAKASATLELVRESQDSNFTVYLQPRAGLDYLSHDIDKAKAQLATVTALMDDIEPDNMHSPEIIHVVGYSEGNDLATPEIIDESIKITRYALDLYRNMKKKGETFDVRHNSDFLHRKQYLIDGARQVISAIEHCIENPYSPEGLFYVFQMGFLPVPQLNYGKENFPEAVRWQTKLKKGCVDIYTGDQMMSPKERMRTIIEEIANNKTK